MNELMNRPFQTRLENQEVYPLNQLCEEKQELPILGINDSSSQIQQQLEFASKVKLPVFIYGEVGTEKLNVAHYIHYNRFFSTGHFIGIPSSIKGSEEFQYHLNKSIESAENGTLYFSNIEQLNDKHKDYLTFFFANKEIQERLTEMNVQLILSSTEPLVCSQYFLPKLFDQNMAVLEVELPPLRERKNNISLYIDYFLKKFGGQLSPKLSTDARKHLCEYSWPQNVSQLQKLMMLLISSNPNEITEQDVLALGLEPSDSSDLIAAILDKKLDFYQHIHPALYKALQHIGSHFSDELSLKDLSDAAFTSPSHLSYLFRVHLNRSFKSTLVEVRVRFARELISEHPLTKITDVCMQSGFGDLSHFEKMFKRYVGCTPRVFRQTQRRAYAELIN